MLALAMLVLRPAVAAVGLDQIAGVGDDGPVALFYPSDDTARSVRRGPFALVVADRGTPARGNGRLVVISHGSGSSPWVHADLARSLAGAGFVVAMPRHRGDNHVEGHNPGPGSWALRPAEVSRAIDALGADTRFALRLDKVGVFGFSAGGHTALSLAGGAWSPAAYRRHCEKHLRDDFQACVGLITQLDGGALDGIKALTARLVIGARYFDETPHTHHDPRIAAVIAAAPFAADFDPVSLATPRVPLGLVTLGQDRWLVPRFHSERVLASCTSCIRIAELPDAGHGAMLSPMPPGLDGLAGEVLNDPPGFDRSALPAVDRAITDFFRRQLLP
jgi:predicted dienelactone hydrolase